MLLLTPTHFLAFVSSSLPILNPSRQIHDTPTLHSVLYSMYTVTVTAAQREF